MGSLRRLLRRTNPVSIAVLVVSSIASGITEAGLLASVAQVAAALVVGGHSVSVGIGPFEPTVSIGALLFVAFGLAILRLALQIPVSVIPARVASEVQAGFRQRLFDAFTDASWATQADDREGHLQEMVSSQTVQATAGSLQAMGLISSLGTFAILIISALLLNPLATAGVVVVAVVLFAGLRPLSALGRRQARELSGSQMKFAGGIGEAVRMAEETRVFGVGPAQIDRVRVLVGRSRDLYYFTQLWGRVIPAVYQGLVYLIVVIGLGALYFAGAGHAASIGAVVLLLIRAGSYAQQIQASYQAVIQTEPFVERLEEAEENYFAAREGTGDRALAAVETVAFEDVSFSYRPDAPVLNGVSFETGRGETIGIIGPSGAGKSTIVQLLLKLRVPGQGQYRVNGSPASTISPHDWHRQVAYVPQEPRLLHASVADNIRYLREEIDDEAVERAAKLARIHDDIVAWGKGYETIVGPRADAVSGGQRQRLCMARALASRPTFLVLDEPTSALDPRSEALLQESLRGLAGNISLFIVAHRMSTLDICDRVMVINGGMVDAIAKPSDLLRDNDYFRSAHSISVGGRLS